MGMFGNIKDLAYHENNIADPYITMPDVCGFIATSAPLFDTQKKRTGEETKKILSRTKTTQNEKNFKY